MPRTGSILSALFALTITAGGLVAWGLWRDDERFTTMGSAALVVLALGATFAAGRRTRGTPVPDPGSRQIQYDFAPPETTAPRPEAHEDLVEFQLADAPQAPTTLHVPSAFQLTEHVDPSPGRLAPADIKGGAAIERRRQMVSGLPLVSSILAEETPAASRVAPSPAGKSRGQCSACGTMLWAPLQRPIRLRCPRCGHVRTLTE